MLNPLAFASGFFVGAQRRRVIMAEPGPGRNG